ncbi:hypothetical protein SAMN04487950_0524 [Halogranum rubrum]|uniref:Uncharacterized protein n=1 Tax=Halogranum rubrum TaxID=553466 RepID=A0A1I4BF67_9EURY|nr:hypothetical protein [Halogranum rubrum]SFK67502.1 hypothetical protein SAMN04487950_0524 [Halogranum rubrum]
MTDTTNSNGVILAALATLVVMLGAMLLGGTVGQVLFSYTIITFFGLYLLLGVQSTAERYEWAPFLTLAGALVGILAVVFAALWYFHFQNPTYTDPTYWLGFPRATAIVVYALWMPPALLLMFAYPYLFERFIWHEDQAERFEQMERTPTSATTGDD